MKIIQSSLLILLLASLPFMSSCAAAISRHNALLHAEAGQLASNANDWNTARREWAKAVVNSDLGKLDNSKKAVIYYEYGRAAGVTCFFDISEEYLNKAYSLDKETNGPAFMSLVELFRLNLDQKKYKKATEYFKKAVPELESVGAPTESPSEFSKLLDEYAIALKGIGNTQEAEEAIRRSNKIRSEEENLHSITDRTPYGSQCVEKNNL
jgi:tetratricopeptide (TPR) repeat protein